MEPNLFKHIKLSALMPILIILLFFLGEKAQEYQKEIEGIMGKKSIDN